MRLHVLQRKDRLGTILKMRTFALFLVNLVLNCRVICLKNWFFIRQFDCGIHPAFSGMAALLYFDEIDPSAIDVLLVTQ